MVQNILPISKKLINIVELFSKDTIYEVSMVRTSYTDGGPQYEGPIFKKLEAFGMSCYRTLISTSVNVTNKHKSKMKVCLVSQSDGQFNFSI